MHTDILLIEDDERLAQLVQAYLQQNGLSVALERTGTHALTRFLQLQPSMVILDIMLPGKNGMDVCKEIRRHFDGPILMLTAKISDIDQVMGLENGADDYVSKPAEPMVLLARIRALMRRTYGEADLKRKPIPVELNIGQLYISNSTRSVSLNGQAIELSTQEFALLWELAANAGTILSRDELFRRIRGIDYDGLDRSIDVKVSRIRKILGDEPKNPYKIKTVWGKGYLLSPDAWSE